MGLSFLTCFIGEGDAVLLLILLFLILSLYGIRFQLFCVLFLGAISFNTIRRGGKVEEILCIYFNVALGHGTCFLKFPGSVSPPQLSQDTFPLCLWFLPAVSLLSGKELWCSLSRYRGLDCSNPYPLSMAPCIYWLRDWKIPLPVSAAVLHLAPILSGDKCWHFEGLLCSHPSDASSYLTLPLVRMLRPGRSVPGGGCLLHPLNLGFLVSW